MNALDQKLSMDYLKSVTSGNFQAGRGTPTFAEFGELFRWNMSDGFPLSTQSKKKIEYVIHEILWFFNKGTSTYTLDAPIWDMWDRELKSVNRIYEILNDSDNTWTLTEYLMKRFETLDNILLTADNSDFSILTSDTPDKGFNLKIVQDCEEYSHELDMVDIHRDTNLRLTTGNLGPIYGKQFRDWITPEGSSVDQLDEFLKGIKENPFSRRHLISLWNPAVLPDETKSHCENIANGKAVLPPCHLILQANVRSRNVCDILIDNSDNGVTNDITKDVFTQVLEDLKVAFEPMENADLNALIWFFELALEKETETPLTLYKNLVDGLYRSNFIIDEDKLWVVNVFKKRTGLTFKNLRKPLDFDEKVVDLLFFMRSNDRPVGRPFNISSYAIMLLMISKCTGYKAGDLVQMTGNGHVYTDQLASVRKVMEMDGPELPTMRLIDRGQKNLWDFDIDDFEISNYNPNKFVKHNVNE